MNDKPAAAPPSRRQFLQGSGLVLASSALGCGEAGAAQSTSSQPKPSSAAGSGTAPIDYVNLLQGTESTPVFSHGNTLPIAATPFGMAHWTLQTNDGTPWMFQPWTRRLQGLRCTHQLSPWLYDYGFATFLPVAGKVNGDPGARSTSYVPEDAVLTPYSMQLYLLRYRAKVELVPTERCCVITAAYDAPANAEQLQAPGMLIDVPQVKGQLVEDQATGRLEFVTTQTSGGTPENFATYYVVQFAEPWTTLETHPHEGRKERNDDNRQIVSVMFQHGRRVEARIGTSFISAEQARYNLDHEIGQRSVSEIRDRTKQQWSELFSRLEIEGATERQKKTFYSCMYRTLLFPRIFHEPIPNGTGVHHYSAWNGKVEPGVMYADHGFWDVYRAWYPLMSLVFPERLSDILDAWFNAYKEGGWFPQFPAPGYRACMSGSLVDSLYGDAIAKGIGKFDREAVFQGLKKHATQPGDPSKGYGRTGVEYYLKLHYVPNDKIEQATVETVDAAFGDFCIAQIAKALGKQEDYQAFTERASYWRNVYDDQIRFFRGKNADRTWQPFHDFQWGSPYEEGGAWQHRWDAPHAIAELIDLIGGKPAAVKALNAMVEQAPVFEVGVYGSEIHEMSEMAAVPFGQYAHSNQPSHHMLYLFAHAGAPDRLQYWARRVMDELYSPEGFAGDEDTGSMAAWYILSSLGLYQVCPGKPEYTFGSPLFPRATVKLPEGKQLVVEAPGNAKETVYVQEITFNGKRQTGATIAHANLVRGGTLRFRMSAEKASA